MAKPDTKAETKAAPEPNGKSVQAPAADPRRATTAKTN